MLLRLRWALAVLVVLFGLSAAQVVNRPAEAENNDDDDTEGTPRVSSTTSSEDNDDDDVEDAITRLRSIETMEDMLALIRKDGRQMNMDDLNGGVDVDGKQTISDGGRLAVPGGCAPRNTTVSLNLESTSSNQVYFPRCTTIERCSGCCASPHLECRSAYTERVRLRVLKARAPFPGSSHLVYHGFAPVTIDRHVRCRVHCTLGPDSCGPKKRFLRNQCTCKCHSQMRCPPPKVWDPEECACKCNNLIACCPSGEKCDMVFNDQTCECDIAGINHINNDVNATEEERENYIANRASGSPSIISGPIAATTQATTTNPCDAVTCPASMIAVTSEGRCLCRPRRNRNQNRRRRPNSRG